MEDFTYTVGSGGVEELARHRTEENGNKNNKKRASWTEPQRKFLIELLNFFNVPHYRGNIGWKKAAWNEMAKRFNQKFPSVNYSARQFLEQEQYLKKAYKAIKGLRDNSSFGWDHNTKRVTAPNDVLEDLFEKNPSAKEWNNKTFLHFDDLAPLYEGCIAEGSHRRGTNRIAKAPITKNMDDTPRTPISSTIRSNWGTGGDFFRNVENDSLFTDFVPSTQVPNFTQEN